MKIPDNLSLLTSAIEAAFECGRSDEVAEKTKISKKRLREISLYPSSLTQEERESIEKILVDPIGAYSGESRK
ncbi:MAG: hypothetical protein AAB732_00940 [Patescibacteria group bacterium]